MPIRRRRVSSAETGAEEREQNWLTSFENDSSSKEDELVGLLAERNLIRAENTGSIFQQTLWTNDSIE